MKRKVQTYSTEFKLMVVEDYLSGKSRGTSLIAKNMEFQMIIQLVVGQ